MSDDHKKSLSLLTVMLGAGGITGFITAATPLLSAWPPSAVIACACSVALGFGWMWETRERQAETAEMRAELRAMASIAQHLHSELVRLSVAANRRQGYEVATWAEICTGGPVWIRTMDNDYQGPDRRGDGKVTSPP